MTAEEVIDDLIMRICNPARTADELRVLQVILTRLEKGADQYGGLVLAGDRRNWARELAEELVDAAIYAACDELSKEQAK